MAADVGGDPEETATDLIRIYREPTILQGIHIGVSPGALLRKRNELMCSVGVRGRRRNHQQAHGLGHPEEIEGLMNGCPESERATTSSGLHIHLS
jgi:hypothetical protein